MSRETKRRTRSTTKRRAKSAPPDPPKPAPRKAAPTRSRPVQSDGIAAGQPYARTQREYAEQYAKPLVTIKRWWARALPLDDPDLMGEYLSPRGRKPADPAPTPNPAPDDFESPSIVVPNPEAGEEPSPIGLDESFFAGIGVLAEIERLQKAARERSAAYFAALRARGNFQLRSNLLKEWMAIVEALRKLEKDAPAIRRANGKSVDRAEIEAAVGETFASFRAAANNLPGRAAAKLEGITDRAEIETILEREIEVLLRTLTELTLAAVDDAEHPAPAEDADA